MPSDVARAVEIFMPPGSVKELRVLTGQGMLCGYFNSRRALALTAKEMSGCEEAKAVYWGLNDIDAQTLRYISNDVGRRTYATQSANIARRKWLLIDVDPQRPKETNADDAEKAEAWKVTLAVQQFLHSLDWPEPVVVDSANGYHSIYPIDLPAQDGTTVRDTLTILSWKYSSAAAVVDARVHDSCRIVKVPGTMGRKGPHSEDRPWRSSVLLTSPSVSRRLSYTDLIALRKYAPPIPPKKMVATPSISQKRLKEFFTHYKSLFSVTETNQKRDGSTHYFLDACPFNDFSQHSNHGLRKTAIIVSADGIGFNCFADQCDGVCFDDLLNLLAEETGELKFDVNDYEQMANAFGEIESLD